MAAMHVTQHKTLFADKFYDNNDNVMPAHADKIANDEKSIKKDIVISY
jgi:hypothetical protein